MNTSRVAELVSIRNFLETKANSYHLLGKETESKMRLAIGKIDKEIIDACAAYLEEKQIVSDVVQEALVRKQFVATEQVLTDAEESAKPSPEAMAKLKAELLAAATGTPKSKKKAASKIKTVEVKEEVQS